MAEERRINQRRKFIPTAQFPLRTLSGVLIFSERRTLPVRRSNDIEVKEISYWEFIAMTPKKY